MQERLEDVNIDFNVFFPNEEIRDEEEKLEEDLQQLTEEEINNKV